MGDLSKKTACQLFSWTQTGASYAAGVDLAQQICRLIYEHVPTRTEIEAQPDSDRHDEGSRSDERAGGNEPLVSET